MHVNKCEFVLLSVYILPLGLHLPIERRQFGRIFFKNNVAEGENTGDSLKMYVRKDQSIHWPFSRLPLKSEF